MCLQRVCKPGSVLVETSDSHLSRMPIAWHLKRSTRTCKRGEQPRAMTSIAPFCLTLLRVGFTQPTESPQLLVSFYLTVSPLPLANQRRSTFCCTCPNQPIPRRARRELAGRRYRPLCSSEPGLSSRVGQRPTPATVPPAANTSEQHIKISAFSPNYPFCRMRLSI